MAGLHELLATAGVDLTEVGSLLHGTTLVTNAIIERRGRPTGLLTTKGFRDVLEMGHEQRYDIYDLFLQYPEPIVPRRWRLEVDERLGADRYGHAHRHADDHSEPEGLNSLDHGAELITCTQLSANEPSGAIGEKDQ